jgi:hypothetical protein
MSGATVIARTKVQNALASLCKVPQNAPDSRSGTALCGCNQPHRALQGSHCTNVAISASRAGQFPQIQQQWPVHERANLVALPVRFDRRYARSSGGSDGRRSRFVDNRAPKNEFKGDKAAFFQLQEDLIKVLHQTLGEPGNLKKADKNGPAVKRIEAVLEKSASGYGTPAIRFLQLDHLEAEATVQKAGTYPLLVRSPVHQPARTDTDCARRGAVYGSDGPKRVGEFLRRAD